ncbi:hypothetical protein F5Y18DRAFT_443849 [Xylariaceae sp. FL1019]|nr:hypothetical protein F5Y18DRAFT_443849 [Xylariaceae sp. FL1019]
MSGSNLEMNSPRNPRLKFCEAKLATSEEYRSLINCSMFNGADVFGMYIIKQYFIIVGKTIIVDKTCDFTARSNFDLMVELYLTYFTFHIKEEYPETLKTLRSLDCKMVASVGEKAGRYLNIRSDICRRVYKVFGKLRRLEHEHKEMHPDEPYTFEDDQKATWTTTVKGCVQKVRELQQFVETMNSNLFGKNSRGIFDVSTFQQMATIKFDQHAQFWEQWLRSFGEIEKLYESAKEILEDHHSDLCEVLFPEPETLVCEGRGI